MLQLWGDQAVTAATTLVTANITLTQAYTNFEALRIISNYDETGSQGEYITDFKFTTNNLVEIPVGNIYNTTQIISNFYKIKAISSTGLAAYYARSMTITETPTFSSDANSNLAVFKIYGVKYKD